jgi:molybdopterin molybdotransferase
LSASEKGTEVGAPLRGWKDVRMRGFQDRTDVADAVALLLVRLTPLSAEAVVLREAADRVLAADVISAVAVPPFDRAAMDGYAVRGAETFGAGPYNPLDFTVVGESLPGRAPTTTVEAGQAVRIMTGAPLPPGADAVLQAEAAEEWTEGARLRVRITEPVPPGRHVGRRGEDVAEGTIVLNAGRVLRPQDVGVLASIGAAPALVIRQPLRRPADHRRRAAAVRGAARGLSHRR